MGRIVGIVSRKGGVGRTTLALNLGWALASLGQRVLLVDADPQGGLGAASDPARRARAGLCDVLAERATADDAIVATRVERLSMLGIGREPLRELAYEEAASDGRLRRTIAALGPGYDTVLVDAPAGTGAPVRALLAASEGALVPVRPSPLCVRSLPPLLDAILRARGAHPALRLDGIVVTARDARSESAAGMLDELRRRLPAGALLRTIVPHDESFELAAASAVPVGHAPGGAFAAEAFLRLAAELRARDVAAPHEEIQHDHAPGLL